MNNRIKQKLAYIEEQNHIRILYACEAGSRATGLANEKSDYDVRFIYIRPLEWYLSLKELMDKDVINVPCTDHFDIQGWDVKKSLQLLKKSNPTLLEWLHSPYIHISDPYFVERIEAIKGEYFFAIACVHHYLNMAKRNLANLTNHKAGEIKDIFTVLRPILACKWIEKYHNFPPMSFEKLMNECINHNTFKIVISDLVNQKRAGEININKQNKQLILEYAEQEIDYLINYMKTRKGKNKNSTKALDTMFINLLEHTWNISIQA